MRKIIIPFLVALSFIGWKLPVKSALFTGLTFLYNTCDAQFTTSGATTADSSWVVYTTRAGTLPINSSKGLIIRDTTWMRFKTRMVLIDSLSGNRSVETPTTLMWVKKGLGCDTMEISPIDSVHISGSMIASLPWSKITSAPAFITTETDPLSVHLTDSATMLSVYLRSLDASNTYATQSNLTAGLATKQNTITTGTTAQYFRGDLSLSTFPTDLTSFTNGPGYTTAASVAATYATQSSLTSGLALKVNISDTAAMLTKYLRIINATTGTVTSIGLTSTDFAVSGSPVTTSGNITANLNTSGVSAATYNGSYTVNNKGIITAANNASFNNAASHSIVTVAAAANGFQVSSTKIAIVTYSIKIVTAVQIGVATNVEGYVVLEIAATNSSTAGDWTEIGRASNGQSISLALALASTQSSGASVSGAVPPGYYARLRSVNVAGTPTYSFISGQEVFY